MTERNRKSNQYWVTGLMAAAFLVTFVIGCAKTEKPGGTADTPVTAAVTDSGMVTDSSLAVDPSLVKDVSLATDSGLDDVPGHDRSRTRAYLRRLDGHWTRHVRVTLHCDRGECANHDSVHIDIFVHRLTFKIDAAKIVAQNIRGHIVAKILNLDAFPYETLGLGARDSVYLWVGKTDTIAPPPQPVAIHRQRAFAVFQIDQQGQATGVARAYKAIRCKRNHDNPESDVHVQKIGCVPFVETLEELYSDSLPPNVSNPATPFHDQGLWFACTGGCCQATTFAAY